MKRTNIFECHDLKKKKKERRKKSRNMNFGATRYKLSIFIVACVLECRIRGEIV
jgi:hypothetical protein